MTPERRPRRHAFDLHDGALHTISLPLGRAARILAACTAFALAGVGSGIGAPAIAQGAPALTYSKGNPVVAATTFPGPRYLLPIYQAAGIEYDIPWSVLASINEIETDFGRNQSPSSAGAMGWMRFTPSTWAKWGTDANHDGVRNPADPVDAIFAAARYLHAAGGSRSISRGVSAFDHADWYVAHVLRRAARFAAMSPDVQSSLSAYGLRQSPGIKRASGSVGLLRASFTPRNMGEVMLLTDRRLRRFVLADHRLAIYSCGRRDIASGRIDRRVLETLEFLAYKNFHARVIKLRCGHPYRTTGGNVSEHSAGAAVDIAAINGTPILGHQGPGSIADKTIRALLQLNDSILRPHQIISLMTFRGAANTMSLPDHANHIHIGFHPARRLSA